MKKTNELDSAARKLDSNQGNTHDQEGGERPINRNGSETTNFGGSFFAVNSLSDKDGDKPVDEDIAVNIENTAEPHEDDYDPQRARVLEDYARNVMGDNAIADEFMMDRLLIEAYQKAYIHK